MYNTEQVVSSHNKINFIFLLLGHFGMSILNILLLLLLFVCACLLQLKELFQILYFLFLLLGHVFSGHFYFVSGSNILNNIIYLLFFSLIVFTFILVCAFLLQLKQYFTISCPGRHFCYRNWCLKHKTMKVGKAGIGGSKNYYWFSSFISILFFSLDMYFTT